LTVDVAAAIFAGFVAGQLKFDDIIIINRAAIIIIISGGDAERIGIVRCFVDLGGGRAGHENGNGGEKGDYEVLHDDMMLMFLCEMLKRSRPIKRCFSR